MISLKSKKGIAVVAICSVVILVFGASIWMPSMMKPSSRAERFDIISKQELRNLYQHLDIYREAHAGKLPVDLSELAKTTGYFEGLTQDARNRRISALEYPLSGSTFNGKRVIATYRLPGGPRFLLLDNGEVVREQ